ncbi:thymidine phosphorylase [Aerophototrophica crusticola]|uniref:Thymidine phosphorylase n=1 Tax=Aerophototrophica crusticola TaxID=1709002 RepID=A0A858R8T7_9PROT|nr:thymidine phosphorylase [Rhodospirillaceae bacterium B3]
MFLPQEVIRTKRDGGRLDPDALARFVTGIADGSVTEGQAAAFAMAVFFRGLDRAERVALLRAMTNSGSVLDWTPEGLPGPILDKHSTGGVGDKVSLVLAPIVAACGGFVPMISGRGLGHTGGTLDKMESIPGYRAQPDTPLLRQAVREAGCAIVGATADIAPADRRLYAIRDVTATVESLDLITCSILSKKLAAGLQGLVLDVKFGSGAFMPERDCAEALAKALVDAATGAGLPTVALLTDMDQVLGRTAGNALEVRECLDILTGGAREGRLWDVTREQTAELLLLGGLATDLDDARAKVDAALDSGRAAEHFARMVRVLGGPADLLEEPGKHLAAAPVVRAVEAPRAGFVAGQDVRAIGLAVVALGGGRAKASDPVDPAVGFSDVAALGTRVGPGEAPLCIVHARTGAEADAAAEAIRRAVTIGEAEPVPQNPVAGRVTAG